MKHSAYLWIVPAVLLIIVIALAVRGFGLNHQVQTLKDENRRAVTALQDSLKRMQADFSAAKEAMPGLGEYMTTMQLHAGKLWFASRATNWELAEYELDELKETMEAAKALNAEKNGVKISNVLDSVLQSQVAQLAESIKHKSPAEFQKSYDQTLTACNGCHESAGYNFIHIVRPTAPPVTNQKWEAQPK